MGTARGEMQMAFELEPKGGFSGDFSIGDRNPKTDTMNIACGLFHEGIDYDLTREEARQVWDHIGAQFGFSS